MRKIFLVFWIMASVFSLKSQIKIESLSLKIPFESINFVRNDTIFVIKFYPTKNNFDSIICETFATKFTKNSWITNTCLYGSYSIIKFKKGKYSQWFKENNGKLFHADHEYIIRRCWTYYPDGSMEIYWHFGGISHCRKR